MTRHDMACHALTYFEIFPPMKKSKEIRAIQCRIGAAVKRNRKKYGLTLEELATKADMGWRHLQKIEAGEVNTTIHTLYKLAKSLNVDPSAFFIAEEEA